MLLKQFFIKNYFFSANFIAFINISLFILSFSFKSSFLSVLTSIAIGIFLFVFSLILLAFFRNSQIFFIYRKPGLPIGMWRSSNNLCPFSNTALEKCIWYNSELAMLIDFIISSPFRAACAVSNANPILLYFFLTFLITSNISFVGPIKRFLSTFLSKGSINILILNFLASYYISYKLSVICCDDSFIKFNPYFSPVTKAIFDSLDSTP